MKTVFALTFLATAVLYSLLSAMSGVLHQGKNTEDLSHLERQVLYGRATIGERLKLFTLNIFASIFFLPAYILAALVTLVYYIFT
jgi:hypothetical protein